MKYIYSYEIAGTIVSLIIFLTTFLRRGYRTISSSLFRVLLIAIAVAAASNAYSAFTISFPGNYPVWFHYIVNLIFYAALNGAFVLYSLFIFSIVRKTHIGKGRMIFVFAAFLLDYLLIFTTPFTKFIFYIASDGSYHHGKFFAVLFAIGLAAVLGTVPDIWANRHNMPGHQIVALILFAVSPIGAFLFENTYSDILISGFSLAVFSIFIYVSVENPAEYIAANTPALNTAALILETTQRINAKMPFTILAIYYSENPYAFLLNEREKFRRVINPFLSELQKAYGANNVFYLRDGRYVIMSKRRQTVFNEPDGMPVLKQICTRKLVIGTESYVSLPHLCTVKYPENCISENDLMPILNAFFTEHTKQAGHMDITDASNEAILKQIRENKIIFVLKEAIKKHSFTLNYQPIYDIKNSSFISAEALARLSDDEMGQIYPDEFIRIAEQNDLIISVNLELFECLCSFISMNAESLSGLKSIGFNLSIPNQLTDKFADRYLELMERYEIDPSFIVFEITEECATTGNKELLLTELKELASKGIMFSMDDFGTGYSNVANLMDMPFETIKIDKSLLWQSMINAEADSIFKDNVNMLQKLGKKVLVEGAENIEMTDKIADYGCDYIQGFYYSAPLAADTFLMFLDSHR